MSDMMSQVREAAARMPGAVFASLDIDPVLIEVGAIARVAPYLSGKGFKRVGLVADRTTYAIAGEALEAAIAGSGVQVQSTLIAPNAQGDVIADEASLVQLILDAKRFGAEVILAVGSGTLHDIARFTAYAISVPFVSVPTAPSVDGFNSVGAPLILRGDKTTIQTIGPIAIFADLDILTKAPAPLVAAGFGDMLGKFTSLFDWSFGRAAAGEIYSDVVADMTRRALEKCVANVEAIAERTPDGIRVLTEALVESGFAMLLLGQSHPASGAEHHLSHYWEMEFLRTGRKQILHGAKVGVACGVIADRYKRWADEGPLPSLPAEKQAEIREALAAIPPADVIKGWLRKIGGPAETEELGVSEELLARSLKEAHRIRPNRFTLLRAYNESR
ncbi:sn-glycerol-1-phosphate dehydrogenase [Cohnella fermenti]|uniref:sn-glycerol-1-phosphate dehydrogenase n=1 Tax=Cohnella fermenti TaxID=2565925 RepID=A0A4S4CCK1_9BACL|nr:sn-glycerol-1-phosphate dehydrogenase [Cohnella fermenti]THF83682.1 sn-glycerol-1-phosphate dehydrogenase [Cohnella fermenti]